jgi:alpha-beta hydrolase superfamily lysophospholipase
VSDAVGLGGFGEVGWDALVDDLVAVSRAIAADQPELPLFLIGHSMGSFALQQAIVDHSDLYRGVVLSGSTALDVMAAGMAEGPVGDLSAFNAGFEPRTGYEWLSRDEAEVDKYVADPLCGFDLAPTTVSEAFSGAVRLADPAVLAGIRSDLPILVVSGDKDPLAGGGQLVELLAQRYRDAGVADVTVKLYPQARHEIFNETNRDEVTSDVIDWLIAHL